ncbi:interferon regulatory factor 4-like [Scleropages formosus]|uniref:Interferon regulatory factor 10 n=1 Tax=Scleropages formosus TaxID=113540 RepID=A0A8C9U165_SCLFO|nr:interferon regulatory factor 4-like [Scleropages formosus]
MEVNGRNMRLREWLIAQVESGKYAGLSWEDQEKSMFRIPWKHAAKQDYKQSEDAALFKAWAVYKGKYREGRDPPDPSVWKTRLRCALNKSTDFREVSERSQLDISEPYKVYKIQPEGSRATESPGTPSVCRVSPPAAAPRPQTNGGDGQQQVSAKMNVNMKPVSITYDGPAKGDACSWPAAGELPSEALAPMAPVSYPDTLQITDFRLRVRLFYQGRLVRDFRTSTPEGCRILHGTVPAENERIYGPCAVEPLRFPPPVPAGVSPTAAGAMLRLLPHLQRGVVLWMAHDGVFAKRFCQGRVYWDGPLVQRRDRPSKLEREKTCKMLDMAALLQELQQFLQKGSPRPRYRIDLCFGEEFPDADKSLSQKLITARVEPLFVRKLLMNLNPPSPPRQGAEPGAEAQEDGCGADDVPRARRLHVAPSHQTPETEPRHHAP